MFTSCIIFYSFLAGINPQLTQAVINVESNGNPYALGKLGDSGLMQIRHKLVPETQQQLFQGCTNVKRGIELLNQARKKCKHQLNNTWLVCYNAGLKGGSKIKRPTSFIYYKKVMKEFRK
jgi:soluble lytic murein transglycosylase-like protein